jgi:hypothetical protein
MYIARLTLSGVTPGVAYELRIVSECDLLEGKGVPKGASFFKSRSESRFGIYFKIAYNADKRPADLTDKVQRRA